MLVQAHCGTWYIVLLHQSSPGYACRVGASLIWVFLGLCMQRMLALVMTHCKATYEVLLAMQTQVSSGYELPLSVSMQKQ